MAEVIVICLLVAGACSFYERGKRQGSRKAYGIGRKHGRRGR
jgi:hypothetical protein